MTVLLIAFKGLRSSYLILTQFPPSPPSQCLYAKCKEMRLNPKLHRQEVVGYYQRADVSEKRGARLWKMATAMRKKKNVCVCVPQVKQEGNMESNLSQHPEIVPVDKLISLNINAECFIPDAAGSECRTGIL